MNPIIIEYFLKQMSMNVQRVFIPAILLENSALMKLASIDVKLSSSVMEMQIEASLKECHMLHSKLLYRNVLMDLAMT